MKKQVLLVVCVLGLSSTAYSNSYSVRTSDGTQCNQNEDTGRVLEIGTAMDDNGFGSLQATYRVQLGKKKHRAMNCGALYEIALQREQLKLKKAKLELQLLETQIVQYKTSDPNGPEVLEIGDDW